jgi:hypothetical protein
MVGELEGMLMGNRPSGVHWRREEEYQQTQRSVSDQSRMNHYSVMADRLAEKE